MADALSQELLRSALTASEALIASLTDAACASAHAILLKAFSSSSAVAAAAHAPEAAAAAEEEASGGAASAAGALPLVSNYEVAALPRTPCPRALLRTMTSPGTARSIRRGAFRDSSAARLTFLRKAETVLQLRPHAAVEAHAVVRLAREAAEAAEADAAQRTVPVLMRLVQADGPAASAVAADEQLSVDSAKKKQCGAGADAGSGEGKSGGGGAAGAAAEDEAAASLLSRSADKARFAVVMCVARWGQLVEIRSEAARRETACAAALEWIQRAVQQALAPP